MFHGQMAALLPHQSHNATPASETILLVHGGFSSASEWDGVCPLLVDAGYHVLIPDLPGHGAAVDIQPFDVHDAASRLSRLIQTSAHNGVAYVAAISIGAHVAACLAAQYPQHVLSLVASGFNIFTPNLLSSLLPPLVYTLQHGSGLLQSPVKEWQRICAGRGSLAVTRDILNILISSRELEPIPVRTLVVAATRKDILPTDNIDHSRRLFATITPDNGSKLVQNRQMRHPWNVEAPRQFAEMIQLSIANVQLPPEFEEV